MILKMAAPCRTKNWCSRSESKLSATTCKIVENIEAGRDVENFVMYMMEAFKSKKAVIDFLKDYDKSVESLKTFPFGYRSVSFEYRRYEIRLKPFKSYNIFFTVDIENGLLFCVF